jgi:hypothetical protein
LNDSPAGLAAWIIEKLRAWSDCGGDIESRFSKDELLTQVAEDIRAWFRQFRQDPVSADDSLEVRGLILEQQGSA